MDIPLSKVPGIGPARLKSLKAAGIDTVRRLCMCLPVDYRDLSRVVPLSEARPGDCCALRVRLVGEPRSVRTRGGLVITKAYVTDDSDTLPAVWYNQPWMQKNLARYEELTLYGPVRDNKGSLQIVCPAVEKDSGIVPVYKPPADIPQGAFRGIVRAALEAAQGQWPDELPEELRRRHGLCERNFAMLEAHLPTSLESLAAARRRLSFEDLLLFQLALWLTRSGASKGVEIPCDARDAEIFFSSLPFRATAAQRRVLHEILADLKSERPMARLVQGDVGSGKTAVAFAAMYAAAAHGYQCAMMAPTEVLARQHYETAQKLLAPLGVSCGLLVGSLGVREKREAHERIQSGDWQIAFGTHALISEGVNYSRLGLVITDEQHRFGVRQKAKLEKKGDAPNVLIMSATPIPRTLALILFGDLDISVVDEIPPGRSPVKTRIVPEDKREGLYGFILKEVAAGRQAYLVCPLVEKSEMLDAKPAEELYEELRKGPLSSLRLALAHGKMKPAELEAALSAFARGEKDLLVCTTVVEVGVDVPNASIMVVENAERFGLSQLHQLRGRVGRGKYQSWCFLMAEPSEKLKMMAGCSDGFEIARKDMEIRGAGDLWGFRQSGFAAPGLNAMVNDAKLLEEAHEEARELFRNADSEQSLKFFALARRLFAERLAEVSAS